MNQRIKELIDKATVPVIETNDYNGMAYETYKFSQELFAELIVRECQFAIVSRTDLPKHERKLYNNVLKEHFGVEE